MQENQTSVLSRTRSVEGTLDALRDTWNDHDIDAMATLFAEDADFVNVVGMRFKSREEIATAHRELHKDRFAHTGIKQLQSSVSYLSDDIALPKRHIPFPLSRLINSSPEPLQQPVVVDTSDPVARGRYLTKVGNCEDCHTPTDKMNRPLPGMAFAGGKLIDEFPTPSANLTPDPSGISYYDEAMFIRTLRTGWVGARPLNPPMPWWNFRNMSDDDLKSIFAYLRTVTPVRHHVDSSEAYLDAPDRAKGAL